MTALNLSNSPVVQQSIDGYRYSIEPFLLINFSNLLTNSRLLDIGTGCGIIPLLVTTQVDLEEIVAVEIQKSLYNFAIKNMSDNKISCRISLIHGDFLDLTPATTHGFFDSVISNPPYRKLNTGRINPNDEKAIARHEISMDLNSLITKTASLLKHEGTFVMAYPPLRLKETQEKLYAQNLFPTRIRFIHGSRKADARIFLIESVKNRQEECTIEPPLFIYNEDRSYSQEMEKIYASFNYSSRPHYVKKK